MNQIIGINATIETPYGTKPLIYADWTASGRAYVPIENFLQHKIGPLIGNTHTENTFTGAVMTKAYSGAKTIIKKHVNASADDKLLFCGSGMTGAIYKLQRILGLRHSERITSFTRRKNPLVQFLTGIKIPKHNKPIVFISHMEHHSNHTSWLETIADVEIVKAGENGLISLSNFEKSIKKYKNRKLKIASITACSNVTGIVMPYHAIAKLTHQRYGYCIVDFACSAPYVKMNMHPAEEGAHLDAICFSAHKFLGGPAALGVLIFNKNLYMKNVPDNPEGGTVLYTNPWKFHAFIEEREDDGTTPFLQGIKTALSIQLKEKMGIENIKKREQELTRQVFQFTATHPEIKILAPTATDRLPIFSFFVAGLHYNLLVSILNDKFRIQMRGRCACAGTFGHILLHLNQDESNKIYDSIIGNDNFTRPVWVRMSLHPTINTDDLSVVLSALEEVIKNKEKWAKDYVYNNHSNSFSHVTKKCQVIETDQVAKWYKEALLS